MFERLLTADGSGVSIIIRVITVLADSVTVSNPVEVNIDLSEAKGNTAVDRLQDLKVVVDFVSLLGNAPVHEDRFWCVILIV